MVTQAIVKPALLHWARERARLSIFELADGLPVKPEKLQAWEAGQAFPTFRQAQKLATLTRVPFGFLFLHEPPQETLPIPDLRTIGSDPITNPSIDLLDTIRQAMNKQAWYVEYLKEHDQSPLSFVGKFTVDTPIGEVVSNIRQELSFGKVVDRGSWEEYFGRLIDSAEQAGILVMRSGIVGNNTHRKLNIGEFRGFAISDAIAPLIFVNSADAPTARLFTLVHELAHLWIGSSGISNLDVINARVEERFCNAVAGEFLVPEELFHQHWKTEQDWHLSIAELAAVFHVSKLVIARRARDLGKITLKDYADYYRDELDNFRKREGAGGDYYRTAGAKNSERFSRAVVTEAFSGRLLLRDAGKLLGVNPSKVKEYAKRLGI